MSVTSKISGAVRGIVRNRRHRKFRSKCSDLMHNCCLLRLEHLVALMAATRLFQK